MASDASSDQNSNAFVLKLTADITESPWWVKDVASQIQPVTRKMLGSYAGIPPDEQVDHIEHIRKLAWALSPYPSVGALTWLSPFLPLHLAHDGILAKARSGSTVLDCGCFVAPDLRYLAAEGSPTANLHGFDIEPGLFDVGFELYRDRARWQGTFVAADGLKPPGETALRPFLGEVDIIWCPKFLHLFARETQICVAVQLVSLLRPVAGSVFAGSQNGMPVAREVRIGQGIRGHGHDATAFLGNEETIKEDWAEVARRTGTRWQFQARLFDTRTIGYEDDGTEYGKLTGYNLQWAATLVEEAKGMEDVSNKTLVAAAE